jgi:pullulanase
MASIHRVLSLTLLLLAFATGALGQSAPPLPDGVARIHYVRPDGDYRGWVLHVWLDTIERVTWQNGLPQSGVADGAAYWDVRLAPDAARVGFIIHVGDVKDPGPDMFLDLERHGREVWVSSGSTRIDGVRPDPEAARLATIADLDAARAHWVARDLILAPAWEGRYALHHDPDGNLSVGVAGIEGGNAIPLRIDPDGIPASILRQMPHLAGSMALRLDPSLFDAVPDLLRRRLALSATAVDGVLQGATGLQIPGVLDDLYATDAPLGVQRAGASPTLSLWAPTARSVRLHLFEGPEATILPMAFDPANGVWSIALTPDAWGRDYLYEVTVYAPSTGRVERNLVTDPYALALRRNSTRSVIVDLTDPALTPPGWNDLVKPPLSDPVDAVIYELHVRDFSAGDASVPADAVGGYAAFTLPESHGVRHLRALADAGVTHLHLLPTFDLATIDEDPSRWVNADLGGIAQPTASNAAARAVEATRDRDPFNWGYDPWHYLVPEGSYARDADGPARTREFREMVMALDALGLKVVVDVVFNHTNAAGQGEKSVLDRIVPGYYHRLDASGRVTTSSCCPNTATEHAMMERLMLDAVALWARAYKVDGFRFDLMGHHLVTNMERVRATLDALTPERDGVHGASLLLYGEGWNFGEMANDARGPNATQANMAGSGIGTFNDRLRDAVRGGGPFDQGDDLVRLQGFATGLGTMPNALTARLDAEAQAQAARQAADLVRLGLAGNLADFVFVDAFGRRVRGDELRYHDQSAGYALRPQDHVVYASKHDNQTLWDIAQLKLPTTLPRGERVRAHLVALSTVAFAQGVPFFHAGSDLLRSKSFDRNSYDAGDAFNAIDWTGETTRFGIGLPLADDNRASYAVMRERLENPNLSPTAADAAFAAAVFQEFLRIRSASPLLRLRSAEEIRARVAFPDAGPDATPGVIVLEIRDDLPGHADLDPAVDRLLIVFNASPQRVNLDVPPGVASWQVHEIQANGADAATLRSAAIYPGGLRATVPPLTTVVFVAPQRR